MKWFRRCWYTDEKRHTIWIEDPYVQADSEEEALKDLIEKYGDKPNIACSAMPQGEEE